MAVFKRDAYPPEHNISPNFEWREFTCNCGKCDDQHLHLGLFPRLERLRAKLGYRAMTITSGYRCPAHNEASLGAKRSRHLLGEAADIQVKGRTPRAVAVAAIDVGFGGVKEYSSWVHVDVRTGPRWIVLREETDR